MVLYATFDNISLYRGGFSEETGVFGEHYKSQVTDKFYHKVVSSTHVLSGIQIHNVS